jgi:hypothetical protein
MARAQGRLPLLGQLRPHGHPRQHRRSYGIRQDHARRDRAQAGAGVGDRRAEQPVCWLNVDIRKLLRRVFVQHPPWSRTMPPRSLSSTKPHRQAARAVSHAGMERRTRAKSCSILTLPRRPGFRTRQPVILNRIDRWPFAPESVQHLTLMGMQSAVWVPLIHRETDSWLHDGGQPARECLLAARCRDAGPGGGTGGHGGQQCAGL